jgi:hypothetical protein
MATADDTQSDGFLSRIAALLPFIFIGHKLCILLTTPISKRLCGVGCIKCRSKNHQNVSKLFREEREQQEKNKREVVHNAAKDIGLGSCERWYSVIFDLLLVASVSFMVVYRYDLELSQQRVRTVMSKYGKLKYELEQFKGTNGIAACMPSEYGASKGYCYTHDIDSHAMTELFPALRLLRIIEDMYRTSFLAIGYVVVFESLFHMAYNSHWAEVPLTVIFSLKDVGHLLLTCLVVMISYGSYLAINFAPYEGKFTETETMVERLYALFLGDLSVAYGMAEHVQDDPVSLTIFSLLYLFFTIFITITAFNIFLSIVIESYTAAQEFVEKRDQNLALAMGERS